MVGLAKSNQNLRWRLGQSDVRTLLHEENRFPQLLLRPKLTAKRLLRQYKGKEKDSCRQFFGLKTAFLEKPIEVTSDNASVSFYAGFSVGMQTSKARTEGSGIASRGFIRHKEYCHSERESESQYHLRRSAAQLYYGFTL